LNVPYALQAVAESIPSLAVYFSNLAEQTQAVSEDEEKGAI